MAQRGVIGVVAHVLARALFRIVAATLLMFVALEAFRLRRGGVLGWAAGRSVSSWRSFGRHPST